MAKTTDDDAPKLPKAVADKLQRMGEAFDKIDRLLLRLGLQGLQRMTQSSAAELLAMEKTAQTASLTTIERELSKLATHVQRYLDRDPLFTMDAYLNTLNRIWLLNRKARELHGQGLLPDQMVEVIGEARRSYELLSEPLMLQPLGASGWVTDTGFVGITIYFYVDGKPDVIYQAANAKPTMYFGTDPRQLMRQPISDYVYFTIYDMAHGAFEFRQAKVSRDGRLSLHKELQVKTAPYLGGKAYEALAVGSWKELLGRLRSSQLHPVSGSTATEVFIEPTAYGEVVIDQKNARCQVELEDRLGSALKMEIALRPENNFLIDNLEAMLGKAGRKKNLPPSALFGRAWIAEGQIKFFPYTGIYNQAIVLTEYGQKRVNEVHLSLESLKRVKEG
jgi:hypothetical protein